MMRQTRNIITISLLVLFWFRADVRTFAGASIQKDQTAELAKWVNNYPPSKGAIKLVRIASHANISNENNKNYLWDPRSIRCDDQGNLYVLDNKSSCIFKFDKNGSFLKKAGRKGQGPGEFQNPYCFYVTHKYVLVSDTGKYEILYFDLDLNFKKSFKSLKTYLSIAANDSFIFAMSMRMTRESPLVDVLDESGKLLSSFGKAIAGMEVHWVTASFGYIDISGNNEIAVAFSDFPTILRYDIKGKFIQRVDCDNEDKYFRYIRKTNEKFYSDINSRVSIPAIMNFHFGKNSFFVLKGSPYVGIIEYDFGGKRISEYWFERSVDYAANDFIVRENKDILFLVKSPEAAIELYRRK